jgi:hypothetical protein
VGHTLKEQFIEKRFNQSSRAIIHQANVILDEHRAEGYRPTLRQLYYQFVIRNLLPNSEKSYKRLGNIISEARLAGLIDWDAIEDRMRFLRAVPHYSGPADFFNEQVHNFAEDLWAGQQHYCEVWIEKDALSGIIERPCVQYRVPFFACRGYASQSGLYEAGTRLRHVMRSGRSVTIFHLGDHDPSGIDMTRDNDERLNMFARTLSGVSIVRLALNKEQIERFNLPPNPAKLTDSRVGAYMDNYGDTSWELDALPAREIERIVVSAIAGILDADLFKRASERENFSRQQIHRVASNWTGAVKGAIHG